jgi:undecaprenyl-diphosphatase
MSVLQSIILGIVQGATEFIPVSSSGHLVLTPYFLGWNIPDKEAFIFDVLSQVATLVAVLIYFRTDLIDIGLATWHGFRERRPFQDPLSKIGGYLLIASVPAGVFGLLFKDTVEQAFSSPRVTAIFLLGTALLLFIAERTGRRERTFKQLNWKDALWIGFFQVLALYPGISRSGATITGGMTRNLDRTAAARFSFLMAVPIMLAAGGAASLDLVQTPGVLEALPGMVPGLFTAAIVGYIAILWLISFLVNRPLYVFAAYCTALSLVTLATMLI